MTAQPSSRVIRAMQRALDALPDPVRTTFVRCRLVGWEDVRIALALGIAIAEVERGLVRAILALHAAQHAGRRSEHARSMRICAWLRRLLPQG